MRGDRPGRGGYETYRVLATPHARGSTVGLEGRDRCSDGYPACAGIDPPCSIRRNHAYWLPRMRGDRPDSGAAPRVCRAATPHARGSTDMEFVYPLYHVGYPACAGIDPRATCPNPSWSRLPRMRGDRPQNGGRRRGGGVATPHARGSTPSQCSGGYHQAGYPACAGIDPLLVAEELGRVRLPRMRGDRPSGCSSERPTPAATPHARGSTLMA